MKILETNMLKFSKNVECFKTIDGTKFPICSNCNRLMVKIGRNWGCRNCGSILTEILDEKSTENK